MVLLNCLNLCGTKHRIEKYPFLSKSVSDSKDAQKVTNFVYIYTLIWRMVQTDICTYMCIIFLEEIEQFFLCHDEIEREQK